MDGKYLCTPGGLLWYRLVFEAFYVIYVKYWYDYNVLDMLIKQWNIKKNCQYKYSMSHETGPGQRMEKTQVQRVNSEIILSVW